MKLSSRVSMPHPRNEHLDGFLYPDSSRDNLYYRNFLLIPHNVLLHVRVSRRNRCAWNYITIVLCRCH